MAKSIIIFLGPPGAGKGTLSRLCMHRLNYRQFSTGNVCRQHIAQQTDIGKEIDFIIKSGKLISDSLIMNMVRDWIMSQQAYDDSIILDGIPRTLAQAQALHELVMSSDEPYEMHLIKMQIDDEVIIRRLTGRVLCSEKSCQAVYSLNDAALSPKVENTCDDCSSALIKRSDDEERAIRQRLVEYYAHENELIEYYTSVGLPIAQIAVEKPVDDVYEELTDILGVKAL